MYAKAHYLADAIMGLDGFALMYPESPFFNEFVVKTDGDANAILRNLEEKGFFGGFVLEKMDKSWKNRILIAVTEKRTKKEMDAFIAALKAAG
jgi:glycine dehydrogenase subunit 1